MNWKLKKDNATNRRKCVKSGLTRKRKLEKI